MGTLRGRSGEVVEMAGQKAFGLLLLIGNEMERKWRFNCAKSFRRGKGL